MRRRRADEASFPKVPLHGSCGFLQVMPRQNIPDTPDRTVAAMALHFEVPVISRDGRIRASDLQTVW